MSDSYRFSTSGLDLSDGDDDKYEIINKVGSGSFAEVIETRDKETNLVVALKKIKILDESQGISPYALREIGNLKLLTDSNAPYVVRLLSVEHSRREVVEVLEFMDTDLTTLIDRKPLPPDQIRSFMHQLLG